MDMNGWYVRDNTFTKCFTDYVVEVKEVQPNHIWKNLRVTIWKGNGLEDTKHSEYFPYHQHCRLSFLPNSHIFYSCLSSCKKS